MIDSIMVRKLTIGLALHLQYENQELQSEYLNKLKNYREKGALVKVADIGPKPGGKLELDNLRSWILENYVPYLFYTVRNLASQVYEYSKNLCVMRRVK